MQREANTTWSPKVRQPNPAFVANLGKNLQPKQASHSSMTCTICRAVSNVARRSGLRALCGSMLPPRRWHAECALLCKSIDRASSRTQVRPPSQARNRQMSWWSTTAWWGAAENAAQPSRAGRGYPIRDRSCRTLWRYVTRGCSRYCRARDSRQGVANRLYGSTKVGIVGEGSTAMAAPPTRQHNPHAHYGRADDVAQLARPQFMRNQAIRFCADRTTVPVTDAISRIASHGRVMLLDFLRQIHDTSHCKKVLGARLITIRPRSFFFAPKELSAAPLEEAGSEM